MKNKKLLSIFLLVIIPMLACSSPLITNLTAHSGDILFADDFSDATSGWTRLLDEKGFMDYYSSGYRIWVNTPGYNYWSTPGLNFQDVRIDVDAARFGGPDENRFGVICRYQDADNYYFFIISSDGYMGIGKVAGGVTRLLGQEMMIFNPSILSGVAPNHLQAQCQGDTLTFLVNGLPAGIAIDPDFKSGDIGLIAGAFDAAGVDVLFDNFVVIKP
ncbi:MAG: hypothetical protein ABIJ65_03095 [Chloroflexota bacterium]